MGQSNFTVESGALKVVFDHAHGAFPAAVYLRNYTGKYENVLLPETGAFSVTTPDNRIVRPMTGGIVRVEKHDDMTKVLFQELTFQDADGKCETDFKGCITYEFYPDGTMFSSIYFLVASARSPQLRDLQLTIGADTGDFDDVRWAYMHRPTKLDGAIIQDQSPMRFLEPGKSISFREISPLISFNCFRPGGETRYVEFFVEGGATLSGKTGENSTAVSWQNNSPVIRWNFQTVPVVKEKLAMQFHNHWGWIIKNPPLSRHKPPFVMYHAQNKNPRYPTDEELLAMKDSGCSVLTLHENWRYDLQNGGVPFDDRRFTEVVRLAHEYGMRVTVYMRGNENATVEELCEWFDRYLQRDFDGLYMDYGGPFCHSTAPDEFYVNGRIHFRKHYQLFRTIRKKLGNEALIFSHTGPFYSGISMDLFDGYVSGEGERGLLIRSRKQHEYFSMASVSCGTMWTAAFPEYSSQTMVPFLAATGQYPHNPLGAATPSSSLTHPAEPGINDRVFRPLWKLWGMIKNERDLAIRNDYNCSGIFPVDPECGHWLAYRADGQTALYVLSNFAKSPRTFEVTPNWANSGFDPAGKKCFLLTPQLDSPGTEQLYDDKKLTISLDGESCAAFYFAAEPADFSEYRKAYHQVCCSGLDYLREIEQQQQLRKNPPRRKQTILTVNMPPQNAYGYEDSLILDLFDNDSFLVEFAADGSFEKICPILTREGKSLFCGESSVPLKLNDLLPPGRHELGIMATCHGEPFYSFFTVTLSDGNGDSYTLKFRNDIEPDRAFFHFDVEL